MEEPMSQTDIYKQREPVPAASDNPRLHKGRRRRSSSHRSFDEQKTPRRRSKNSGIRRWFHLSRKAENEKNVWWGFLIMMVVILGFIAIWQFWFLEQSARKEALINEYNRMDNEAPVVDSAVE